MVCICPLLPTIYPTLTSTRILTPFPACLGAPASAVAGNLVWQGDRVKLEGCVRVNCGPKASVARQLPVQKQAYLMGPWAF